MTHICPKSDDNTERTKSFHGAMVRDDITSKGITGGRQRSMMLGTAVNNFCAETTHRWQCGEQGAVVLSIRMGDPPFIMSSSTNTTVASNPADGVAGAR